MGGPGSGRKAGGGKKAIGARKLTGKKVAFAKIKGRTSNRVAIKETNKQIARGK
jgi:hypothetical protein